MTLICEIFIWLLVAVILLLYTLLLHARNRVKGLETKAKVEKSNTTFQKDV